MKADSEHYGYNGVPLDPITVGLTDSIAIGEDPDRRCLVLSCPGQQVYIRFKQAMTAAGQGIPVPTSGPPLILTYKEIGNLIQTEVHALALAASSTLIAIVGRR